MRKISLSNPWLLRKLQKEHTFPSIILSVQHSKDQANKLKYGTQQGKNTKEGKNKELKDHKDDNDRKLKQHKGGVNTLKNFIHSEEDKDWEVQKWQGKGMNMYTESIQNNTHSKEDNNWKIWRAKGKVWLYFCIATMASYTVIH